jgi:hypothetical protein
MSDMEGHAKVLAEAAHEGFVGVGLLAPQMEVAVSGLDAIVQRKEHTQQSHGVGSATQGDKHGRTGRQQSLALDVVSDGVYHIGIFMLR